MRYIYCPQCGTKLIGKKAGDEGKVPYCEKCRKYWFDSFSNAAIVLVANEEHEIAMLQQSYLSSTYWTYVSGFIQPQENAEETAIREVKEELGLQVEKLMYGGTHWFEPNDQLMHAFIGLVKKKELVLSEEIARAEWVPYTKALERMFPERPGNCLQPLYRQYVEMLLNDKL